MEISDDIKQALESSGGINIFNALPPSHQNEYIKWIDEAKKTETRARRIEKMCMMIAADQKAG